MPDGLAQTLTVQATVAVCYASIGATDLLFPSGVLLKWLVLQACGSPDSTHQIVLKLGMNQLRVVWRLALTAVACAAVVCHCHIHRRKNPSHRNMYPLYQPGEMDYV